MGILTTLRSTTPSSGPTGHAAKAAASGRNATMMLALAQQHATELQILLSEIIKDVPTSGDSSLTALNNMLTALA